LITSAASAGFFVTIVRIYLVKFSRKDAKNAKQECFRTSFSIRDRSPTLAHGIGPVRKKHFPARLSIMTGRGTRFEN